MIIKIFIGPKEREFYEKKLILMDWPLTEIKAAIVEDADSIFFDAIQNSPNGIEFVDTDENFDEQDAQEQLRFMEESQREYDYDDDNQKILIDF